MAEGRGQAAWAHTSSVLALLANIHRNPKKHRAFRPEDFSPYAAERTGQPAKTRDLGILKAVFVERKGGH